MQKILVAEDSELNRELLYEIDMTLRVYTHYDQRSRKTKTAEKVREALRT